MKPSMGPSPADCPFCHIAEDKLLAENEDARAFLDGYPITEGHTLVVPKRHVPSVFDLDASEQESLWQLVKEVRGRLTADAFNVGVNDGPAAGQTVSHAHVHVIPRREGDISDPRGGIRWVLPKRAKYWK